jgi:hypothetical protein
MLNSIAAGAAIDSCDVDLTTEPDWRNRRGLDHQ